MDDIQPRIRQLAAEIDRLEAAVGPLLLGKPADPATSSDPSEAAAAMGHAAAAMHLPLLDKAKLHVLASFALESSLYCSLGLAGVDARNHAVFRELQRVRQYMTKIDTAEKTSTESQQPTSCLDKAAAIRFVKADVDDPGMKAQLNKLLKEEQAAAVAETQSRGSGAAIAFASSSTPPPSLKLSNNRKRGGSFSRGGSESGSHLTKRPKQQQGEARGRGQISGRGSRAT
ncbi:exosome-associated family protein [Ophiostoma piceae UAMH 11346]|uniref:Exosome complex protein n=1 Tax=Ophiostoma piceae (strain UAMH 11346) TaxID=1262450 RepID=S3C6M3_OPHP1|nr:exosome-associated family protein [Ophiostoma piceae UAMH 11346]